MATLVPRNSQSGDREPRAREGRSTLAPVTLCLPNLADALAAADVLGSLGRAGEVIRDLRELLEREGRPPSGVILDGSLIERDGEVVTRLRQRWPELPILVLCDGVDARRVVSGLRHGANECLGRPLDRERLRVALRPPTRVVPADVRPPTVDEMRAPLHMVGSDPQMLDLYKRIAAITRAPVRSTVLISGETGVGKSMVAQVIHESGTGQSHPFVTVHCSGVPGDLLSNELFGHERGAFTGAERGHMGRIEAAGMGTLFLDEIGEIDASMQVKLLRLLDTGQYERLGSNQTRIAKCRFITATNRDLRRAVEAGRFRRDLYHRLRIIELRMPPLRERRDDIPQITEHVLANLSRTLQRPITLTDEAMAVLRAASLLGNVRELKNVLEAAAVLSETGTIDVAALTAELSADSVSVPAGAAPAPERRSWPPPLSDSWEPPPPTSPTSSPRSGTLTLVFQPDLSEELPPLEAQRNQLIDEFEAAYLRRVLACCDGNVTAAAKVAGVSRQHLQRLMKKHNVRSLEYREPSGPVPVYRATDDASDQGDPSTVPHDGGTATRGVADRSHEVAVSGGGRNDEGPLTR